MENKKMKTVYVKRIPISDHHFAGSDGEVYSIARGVIHQLAWRIDKRTSYKRINMRLDGQHKTFPIHQLVCMAFHGDNRPLLVLHGDGNRFNCKPSNLRWGSALENAADRELHGTVARGESNGASVLTLREVIEIHELHEGGKSVGTITLRYGVSRSTIERVVTGESWAHIYNTRKKYNADSTNGSKRKSAASAR